MKKHYKKIIVILLIVVLSVALILTCMALSFAAVTDSMMDSVRKEVTVYVPSGYPDDYFHNFAFQDPISICSFELSGEEQNEVMNEISTESSEWRQFSKSDVSTLNKIVDFLDEKERMRVNFDTESYYCCYTRTDYYVEVQIDIENEYQTVSREISIEEKWIDLKDAKYYSLPYIVFVYNPKEALYNVIIM